MYERGRSFILRKKKLTSDLNHSSRFNCLIPFPLYIKILPLWTVCDGIGLLLPIHQSPVQLQCIGDYSTLLSRKERWKERFLHIRVRSRLFIVCLVLTPCNMSYGPVMRSSDSSSTFSLSSFDSIWSPLFLLFGTVLVIYFTLWNLTQDCVFLL